MVLTNETRKFEVGYFGSCYSLVGPQRGHTVNVVATDSPVHEKDILFANCAKFCTYGSQTSLILIMEGSQIKVLTVCKQPSAVKYVISVTSLISTRTSVDKSNLLICQPPTKNLHCMLLDASQNLGSSYQRNCESAPVSTAADPVPFCLTAIVCTADNGVEYEQAPRGQDDSRYRCKLR